MDYRQPLLPGTEIVLAEGKRIIIHETAGRGGTCLVYCASCYDGNGVEHRVRIKECYPYDLSVERGAGQQLVVKAEEREEFEEAKRIFSQSYQKNVEFRNLHGLVNSTSDVYEIFAWNSTLYTLAAYDEGMDYKHYKDRSLKELLEHIRTAALVVKKYHENGYLHLDLKPENIFILPETTQHILLFDFDSVISQKELWGDFGEGNVPAGYNSVTFNRRSSVSEYRMCCSDGFSAPEQEGGKIWEIGTQSDVYSLGAVLFYKLFGRTPGFEERRMGAEFDFSDFLYQEDGYPPVLFQKLSQMLKKTLSASVHFRWGNMDNLIEALDELIGLSDLEGQFVYDNFSYNSAGFAGRRKELAQLGTLMEKNKAVFLSGLGGIGKTELARRYVYENREKYNRVVFLSFGKNIMETVLSVSLRIHAFEQESVKEFNEWVTDEKLEEKKHKLFENKILKLQELLREEDLLVIDNFDVAGDEDLETLLGLPCRFIFTTREDYSEYNYPQLPVKEMEEIRDIMDVFFLYNDISYNEKEIETVRDIVELVERHTMLVELIAKYLLHSGETPENLYRQFQEKNGIWNASEQTAVKNRKDRKLRKESIQGHLKLLFDMFAFEKTQKKLLMSLSLLGPARLPLDLFWRLFDFTDEEEVEQLLVRGWISKNEENEEIWLHPVIVDMVYSELNPEDENCPEIVESFTRYLDAGYENKSEWDRKQRVSKNFMERLEGHTLAYARLCIAYSEEKYFDRAEAVCQKYQENEKYHLLYCIDRLRILTYENDRKYMEILEEEELASHYRQNLKQMRQLAKHAVKCARCYDSGKGAMAEAVVMVGYVMKEALGSLCFMDAPEKEMKKNYRQIEWLFKEGERLLTHAELPPEKKLMLLQMIKSLYLFGGICETYRNDYVVNSKRAWHYQILVNACRREYDIEEKNPGCYIVKISGCRSLLVETYEVWGGE